MSQVILIQGSKTDDEYIVPCCSLLTVLRLTWERSICSCHRDGPELEKYLTKILEKPKARVFICVAGMAADLPGIVSSKQPRQTLRRCKNNPA